MAPTLTHPAIAIAIVGAGVAVLLAWKSVAYPLALAGIPTLLVGVLGTKPLPTGGATFLIASWVGLAVAIVVMRDEQTVPSRGLMTLPVAAAVVLLALMLLRLGSSPAHAYGARKIQLYAASNLVLLVGAVFVGADRRSLRLFLTLTLAVVAAGSILLLVRLLTGTAQQQFSGRFVISAVSGPINLGRDSANGTLICISLILISSRLSVRLAALAALPVLLISLVAAGSRGPTLAFAVGLAALVALTATTGRARRRLLLVVAGMVAAAIILPAVLPGSAIARSLSAIVGRAGGLSDTIRSNLWTEAYSTFGQHPLFGIGTGGFAAIDPELYPHNLLLEMAVELGVLGVLAVISMMVTMLRRLSTVWRRTSGTLQIEVALVIALFLSALVNAMISGAIQDNSDIWLWGGLGLGLYALSGSVEGQGVSRAPTAF